MGRLFWKSFLLFWLALLLASGTVGVLVWWQSDQSGEPGLAFDPPARYMMGDTLAALRHAGVAGLRETLARRGEAAARKLYAVDANGRDLLGRAVPAAALAQARHLVDSGRPPESVALARDDAGQTWLLFSVQRRHPPPLRLFAPPRPPGSPDLPPPPGVRAGGGPGLWLLVTGLLASLAFSALLAWRLARPIRHLRDAFAALAQGRLETRVAPRMARRRDDLADLGRDFDYMAERLQALVEAQHRLLHDVSHELRSPLARLHAAIGLARQQPERLAATLDRIERESERLDRLVGELLTLSRLQTGIKGLAEESLDWVELVRGVVEDAHFEAQVKACRVECFCEGELTAPCRPELLHRALENVVRNAVKFSPPDSTVEVHPERPAPGRFRIRVLDRGPGVAEAELEAIFQPFHRGETATSTPGFGLGLAIARQAIQAHGGEIHAGNRPEGGLEVCIDLPLPE